MIQLGLSQSTSFVGFGALSPLVYLAEGLRCMGNTAFLMGLQQGYSLAEGLILFILS